MHGNQRSKELFQRWAEMAAFTPLMRSHEGNRPDDNHQYDTDAETMAHLARMTKIYKHLKPYIQSAVSDNATKGIPVQRPLFMHYEQDSEAYHIQYQYLFGRDLLVAPVYNQGETVKHLYLPEEEWVHVWSGKTYTGGWVEVDAPIGQPPVFYRQQSKDARLLAEISRY
ncbi:TIM-barrel domain-containing protein [Vibrio spartinae]|uniref:TIM-barrel domain-containing protein n=1 Tax=Vibrio spartinae TaxID=1918945 RepID=UPI00225E14D4|nr:TIM-barrel domain-containing protein [Vibrio spartinae]